MAESSQSLEGQSKHALEVFPEEVWKHLFDVIKPVSPETLYNCFNSCVTLKGILEQSKHDWLMKLVFPIIYPFLGDDEILLCRRVSKTWNKVVDEFLAKARLPFNEATSDVSPSSESNCFTRMSSNILGTTIGNKERLLEFTEQMKGKTDNIFVGYSLKLDDTNEIWPPESDDLSVEEQEALLLAEDEKRNAFWTIGLQLISSHVEHIRHLDLQSSFEGDGFDVQKLHQILCPIISKLTNLQSLRIAVMLKDVEMEDQDQFNVEAFFEANPFPNFIKLEKLEFFIDGLHAITFANALLASVDPKQLKSFKMDFNSMDYEDHAGFTLREPLSHLTELFIAVGSEVDLENFLNDLFGVVGNVELGKLTISIVSNDRLRRIDDDRLCNIINRFSASLKVLNVEIKLFDTVGEIEPARNSLSTLSLPILRTLNLNRVILHRDRGTTFTPRLEYMKVTGLLSKLQHYFASGIHVDTHKLQEAAIWEELENLKEVKLEYLLDGDEVEDYCTRAMYDDTRRMSE